MSIKDAGARYAAAIENELIQIKADQMEAAEGLTGRINGVAHQVKELRTEVASRLERVEGDVSSLKETQEQMLGILIDIQRRLAA